jgi:cadmium resistance protein CadD (predicted permease)
MYPKQEEQKLEYFRSIKRTYKYYEYESLINKYSKEVISMILIKYGLFSLLEPENVLLLKKN